MPPVEVLQEYFNYDPDTGILTRAKDVSRVRAGDTVGSTKSKDEAYLRVSFRGANFMLHRLIWTLMTGEDPAGYQIDHIDGDKVNNRWANLRKATQTENIRNGTYRRVKAAGVGSKGVSWRARERVWIVEVSRGERRPRYRGRFHRFADAHAAAISLRNEYHGEFAHHGEFAPTPEDLAQIAIFDAEAAEFHATKRRKRVGTTGPSEIRALPAPLK